jgi:hypothetical protein
MFNEEWIIMTAFGDKITLENFAQILKKNQSGIFEYKVPFEYDLLTMKKDNDEVSVDIISIRDWAGIDAFVKKFPTLKFEFYIEDYSDVTKYIREYENGKVISSCLLYWKDVTLKNGGCMSILFEDDDLPGTSRVLEELIYYSERHLITEKRYYEGYEEKCYTDDPEIYGDGSDIDNDDLLKELDKVL